MRYFIGFLVTIGLIILVIVLLFGGGGKDKAKVPATSKPLVSYASSDAAVRLTVDGPINAEQNHRQTQITVTKNMVTYAELGGYKGVVRKSQAYTNTEAAYTSFLRALALAGFTSGDTSKDLQDERGYCAQGNRNIFELIQSNKDVERYWSTSCGKPKTYLGNSSLTISLFKAQVPNYDDLTNNNNDDFSINL